mmetsp:Transcript_12519/g.36963  ORF Transcript_12519/g.36963 Transcript_12519/m.36963 type:complete len:210 (-) Transcript_12519:2749-3378(-)
MSWPPPRAAPPEAPATTPAAWDPLRWRLDRRPGAPSPWPPPKGAPSTRGATCQGVNRRSRHCSNPTRTLRTRASKRRQMPSRPVAVPPRRRLRCWCPRRRRNREDRLGLLGTLVPLDRLTREVRRQPWPPWRPCSRCHPIKALAPQPQQGRQLGARPQRSPPWRPCSRYRRRSAAVPPPRLGQRPQPLGACHHWRLCLQCPIFPPRWTD